MSNPNDPSHTHTHSYSNLDIPIFAKLYEFYKLLYQYLKLFPKRDRYSLGQRIDNLALGIFELIFKTALVSQSQKIELLQEISAKLDLLKILIRLAHDNKCFSTKAYLLLQQSLQEIGKMTGGWIRHLKNS